MLSSITPLGERGRRRRWGATVTAYLLGSVTGGAVLGALTGGLGAAVAAALRPAPGVVALAAAAVCIGGLLLDSRVLGVGLPTLRRQVDETWLPEYRGWVVGFGFGVQLGLGVTTIVTTAAVYVTWLLATLTGSPLAGLAVGATFGAARALPVLAVRAVTTPQRLAEAHRRLAVWARPASSLAAAAQGAVGVTLVAAVATGVT